MPVAGLRRVSMEFALSNGDIAVNVMHVLQDTPSTFTEGQANTLQAVFNVDWWDEYKSSIADVVSLTKITVADASGETGLAYEEGYSEPGLAAATPLPYQLAACVSLRTAVNSRSGRGRIFVCGYNEAANTAAAKIASAVVTELQDAAANLMAALVGVDHQLVVYSRTLDAANPVTTVIVDDRWDVQRRRANAS